MIQVLVNSLTSAALNLLVGVSFWLVFAPTKTFYISHAAAITIGAYGCYWLSHQAALPFAAAFGLAVILTAFGFGLLEKSFLRHFRIESKGWLGLVTSIGLYVVLQNIVSLLFGEETLVLRSTAVKPGLNIAGAHVNDAQVAMLIAGAGIFVIAAILLASTRFGREVRGLASNADLCEVLGINADRITQWAITLGSGLAGVAGVLAGLDADLQPTMGFRLLLNGVVVMLIGGIGGIRGFPLAALVLALAQHVAAYFLDAKWMDAIAFCILIGFLILKPHGFSERRLRKVEI